VSIRRHPEPGDAATRAATFALVEAGFGLRRKMLRRSLAEHRTIAELEGAGIRPEARAEELALEDWLRLVPHVTG
jgi:16S rRNA (adenine1518-N6/adenine1519-N6)-dimethyltransferase